MCVVTLDVGTSSVRTALFDERGREVGFGAHIPYEVHTTADGGVEVGADELAGLVVEGLSRIHAQMKSAMLRPSAVAFSAFWHNVLGVSADGRPTTPVLHPFDTRSSGAARKLAQRIDPRRLHARTGCVRGSMQPAQSAAAYTCTRYFVASIPPLPNASRQMIARSSCVRWRCVCWRGNP